MDTLQKKKNGTAILVTIVFFSVCLHWTIFTAFAAIMAFFAFLEFKEQKDKSTLAYLLPIALVTLALISTSYQSWYIMVIIFTIMLTDVAANVVGKLWKKIRQQPARFAPIISPSKTWAGAFGSMLGGGIGFPLILFLVQFWQQPELTNSNVFLVPALVNPFAYSLGVTIGWLGQIGDLLFSFKKRKWGIKDYYFSLDRGYQVYIFGSHGGVCDRLDSWTLVSLLFGFLLFGDFLIANFSNEVIKVLPLMVLIHADTYRVNQIQNANPLDIEEESDDE